eukprot:1335282-Amorphochlora_amoeboformis.AAC.2
MSSAKIECGIVNGICRDEPGQGAFDARASSPIERQWPTWRSRLIGQVETSVGASSSRSSHSNYQIVSLLVLRRVGGRRTCIGCEILPWLRCYCQGRKDFKILRYRIQKVNMSYNQNVVLIPRLLGSVWIPQPAHDRQTQPKSLPDTRRWIPSAG